MSKNRWLEKKPYGICTQLNITYLLEIWNYGFYNYMVEPEEDHTEWSESEGENQIESFPSYVDIKDYSREITNIQRQQKLKTGVW